jgi:hypothetical protein
VTKLHGWQRDPFGLHQQRYLSQGQPTKLVRDGTVESYDEPPEGRSPPGAPVEESTISDSANAPSTQEPQTTPSGSSGDWEEDERPLAAVTLEEASTPVRSGTDSARWWWSGPAGLVFAAACVLMAALAAGLVLTSDHGHPVASVKRHVTSREPQHSSSSGSSTSSSSGSSMSTTPPTSSGPLADDAGVGAATSPGAGSSSGAGNVVADTLGPSASPPGGNPAQTPETPVAILLPIGAVAVLGGAFALRRHRKHPTARS